MEGQIQFITQFNDFLGILFSTLQSTTLTEVLISGTWDGPIYKRMVENVINNNHVHKMKIIIPNVLSSATFPRLLINKVVRLGGSVHVNSSFGNNLIIVDGSAFIASYSFKYNSESGGRNVFESCILTRCQDTVGEIRKLFIDKWNCSFPLVIEGAQGETV